MTIRETSVPCINIHFNSEMHGKLFLLHKTDQHLNKSKLKMWSRRKKDAFFFKTALFSVIPAVVLCSLLHSELARVLKNKSGSYLITDLDSSLILWMPIRPPEKFPFQLQFSKYITVNLGRRREHSEQMHFIFCFWHFLEWKCFETEINKLFINIA